jgi:glycosyltransferase involved in cell wall biosynthesis
MDEESEVPVLRVAWFHPAVTDFRLGLFERMASRFDLALFVALRGVDLPAGMPVAFSTLPSFRATPNVFRLPFTDVLGIVRLVWRSDVFVSSFTANAYTMVGLLVARLQRKPVVVWEEMQQLPTSKWHSKIKSWLIATMARRIDAFFIMGDPQRACLRRLGVGAERIFQSIEAPATRFADVRAAALSPEQRPDGPFVLYLGRLIPVKGVSVLLEAFARVQQARPDVSLVIAGDGPLRAELAAQARALDLRKLHFLGHVSGLARKAWLLQNAEVLAVTSIFHGDQAEGGPLVIPEALSAGTPVVCTEACGNTVQYVRAPACGSVTPPADPGALAEALLRHLSVAPSRDEVLRRYDEFPGHDDQAERLTQAVRFAWEQRRRGADGSQGRSAPARG